jgi:hypothetical protein
MSPEMADADVIIVPINVRLWGTVSTARRTSTNPDSRRCRDKVKRSNPFITRGAIDRFARRCRMEGNKVKPVNPDALDKL